MRHSFGSNVKRLPGKFHAKAVEQFPPDTNRLSGPGQIANGQRDFHGIAGTVNRIVSVKPCGRRNRLFRIVAAGDADRIIDVIQPDGRAFRDIELGNAERDRGTVSERGIAVERDARSLFAPLGNCEFVSFPFRAEDGAGMVGDPIGKKKSIADTALPVGLHPTGKIGFLMYGKRNRIQEKDSATESFPRSEQTEREVPRIRVFPVQRHAHQGIIRLISVEIDLAGIVHSGTFLHQTRRSIPAAFRTAVADIIVSGFESLQFGFRLLQRNVIDAENAGFPDIQPQGKSGKTFREIILADNPGPFFRKGMCRFPPEMRTDFLIRIFSRIDASLHQQIAGSPPGKGGGKIQFQISACVWNSAEQMETGFDQLPRFKFTHPQFEAVPAKNGGKVVRPFGGGIEVDLLPVRSAEPDPAGIVLLQECLPINGGQYGTGPDEQNGEKKFCFHRKIPFIYFG